MAQTQAAITEEAARQNTFNGCIGYRAIPGTPAGSVWAVRTRGLAEHRSRSNSVRPGLGNRCSIQLSYRGTMSRHFAQQL